MKKPLRILHLEDDPWDVELIHQTLRAADIRFTIQCVPDKKGFLTALDEDKFDLILADYTLPSFDGMSALTLARKNLPAPRLFLSQVLWEKS